MTYFARPYSLTTKTHRYVRPHVHEDARGKQTIVFTNLASVTRRDVVPGKRLKEITPSPWRNDVKDARKRTSPFPRVNPFPR